jgi:hypothetical protein
MGRYRKNRNLNFKLFRAVLNTKTFDDRFLLKKVKVFIDGVWMDYQSHLWLSSIPQLRTIKNGSLIEFMGSEYDYQSSKRHDPLRSSVWNKTGVENLRRIKVI